jgi:hypothetical protein
MNILLAYKLISAQSATSTPNVVVLHDGWTMLVEEESGTTAAEDREDVDV